MKCARNRTELTNILIGGDTCPIGRNLPLFEAGEAQTLLNDLLPEIEKADLSIVNLECPLIREESPIEKMGPTLGTPEACAKGLKAMGIDVVGLANNHIMDHGPRGLRSTIEALEKHGIKHVGAGENLNAARRILVREVNGIRIGILAVAEHEFGIAAKNTPGANPIDVIDFVRNINEHRSEYDTLIVLVHRGSLHYEYPSPMLLETCRFLVEQGASAVICQHSHCTGCMETYQQAPIIYGQGNFIFDEADRSSAWYKGILVSLEIRENGKIETRLIPYLQSNDLPGARKMSENDESAFLDDFAARSEAIADNSYVVAQWKAFSQDRKRYYLNTLHGNPGFIRRLAGKLGLLHYLDSREVQRTRLHLIRCESHRESLITVLSIETNRHDTNASTTSKPPSSAHEEGFDNQ